jgi:hypothetical protein
MNTPRLMTALGLAVGAVGVGLLWAAGLAFPFYPPPGMLILTAGVIFVLLARMRWAPVVGPILGVLLIIGTLANDGINDLTGGAGAGIAIGSIVSTAGMLFGAIAGIVALRKERAPSAVHT